MNFGVVGSVDAVVGVLSNHGHSGGLVSVDCPDTVVIGITTALSVSFAVMTRIAVGLVY